jgi:hypothetical protein
MPGTIQITIIGSNTTTGELTFQNDAHTSHGNTQANRGDLVLWHINPGSGVSSVTAIQMKAPPPSSTNIFVTGDPHQSGSGNWQGRIDSSVAIDSEYYYLVRWTDNNSNSYVFDPMIKVNP